MAKRQERERRYIVEYLLVSFPEGNWKTNQPLGEVPAELVKMRGLQQAAAMFRPQRRRVDAVAWTKDAYFIIEAKIRDPFEGLGRLMIYAAEAAETADLPGFEGQPIIPRLVVPFRIERDQRAAQLQDIEMVEFRPDWIADYVRERQLYHTAPFRRQREELKRNREIFGLE